MFRHWWVGLDAAPIRLQRGFDRQQAQQEATTTSWSPHRKFNTFWKKFKLLKGDAMANKQP